MARSRSSASINDGSTLEAQQRLFVVMKMAGKPTKGCPSVKFTAFSLKAASIAVVKGIASKGHRIAECLGALVHVSKAEAGEQFQDLPFDDGRHLRHRQPLVQPCGRSGRTLRCGCQANAQSAMVQKPAPT